MKKHTKIALYSLLITTPMALAEGVQAQTMSPGASMAGTVMPIAVTDPTISTGGLATNPSTVVPVIAMTPSCFTIITGPNEVVSGNTASGTYVLSYGPTRDTATTTEINTVGYRGAATGPFSTRGDAYQEIQKQQRDYNTQHGCGGVTSTF